MNKLGFYVENTTVQYLRDALRKVLPPTVLIHAVDRGLLREIRAGLSPNTFMIGRLFVDQSQQTAWLDSGDPAAAGRAFAEQIINYDFSLAKERGQNGRLLIDAWMSLNEPVRGPASFPDGKPDAETRRRLDALDKFQEAFYLRLARTASRQWLSTSPRATSPRAATTWTTSRGPWFYTSTWASTSTAGPGLSRAATLPQPRCSIAEP